MLILFQSLFVLFSLFAIMRVVATSMDQKGKIFWVLFWLLAAGAVLWPQSTTKLANLLGIGRGADFIIYISLALIFYLLFSLHIKIESINRDVTKVVRDKALDKHKNFKS